MKLQGTLLRFRMDRSLVEEIKQFYTTNFHLQNMQLLHFIPGLYYVGNAPPMLME